jgi:hypothetical protein
MGPIDYSAGNAVDPSAAFLQALNAGRADLQFQQQRDMQQQQQQAALQAQARVQQVLSNPNASHEDLIGVMQYMDPKVSAEVLKAKDAADKDKAQAALSHGTQVMAALRSGATDIGVKMLEDRAAALKNSGRPHDAERFQALADQARTSPIETANAIGISLTGLPGSKDTMEALSKLGEDRRATEQAPFALRTVKAGADKAEADAQEAAIKAKYGEQTALLDLQKKGWDITKVQADIQIAKEANRIAAMNAASNRESNVLKRTELGLAIQKTQRELDQQIRDKAAEAEGAAANIDNMLNTIERVKKNPSLDGVVGSIQGRLDSLAVMSDEKSDAIALINTLGSQTFLAQVPQMKAMGSLSNAEGEKLQSSLQNLSRAQSEEQFRANLDEAARLVKKARDNISRRTGVPLKAPDTPAAPGARPALDSFFKG